MSRGTTRSRVRDSTRTAKNRSILRLKNLRIAEDPFNDGSLKSAALSTTTTTTTTTTGCLRSVERVERVTQDLTQFSPFFFTSAVRAPTPC